MLRILLMAALVSGAAPVFADDAPILGLQLGKKLDRDLLKCPEVEGANKDYCGVSGIVKMDSPSHYQNVRRPSAYATFNVPMWMKEEVGLSFSDDGLLIGISINTMGPSVQGSVISALQNRFGKPIEKSMRTVQNAYGATWDEARAKWVTDSVVIKFSCLDRETCMVTFNTPEREASNRARDERMLQRNKL